MRHRQKQPRMPAAAAFSVRRGQKQSRTPAARAFSVHTTGNNSPERLRQGHSVCTAGKNSPNRVQGGAAHLACVHGKGARAAVFCTHRHRNRDELPLIALSVRQTGFQLAFACTLRLIAGVSYQLEEEIALGLFVRKGRQGHSACATGKNSPVCLRQWHSACVAGKNSPERLRQRHSACVAGKNSPVCLRRGTVARTISDGRPGAA